MTDITSISRKNFLAASAGIVAAPLILPSGVYGAEQALKIGLIGCGRMGLGNILSVFGLGDEPIAQGPQLPLNQFAVQFVHLAAERFEEDGLPRVVVSHSDTVSTGRQQGVG